MSIKTNSSSWPINFMGEDFYREGGGGEGGGGGRGEGGEGGGGRGGGREGRGEGRDGHSVLILNQSKRKSNKIFKFGFLREYVLESIQVSQMVI